VDLAAPEKMREILKLWDDGLVSRADFDCRLHDMFLDPFLEGLEKGETLMRGGSCCCSSHAPERTFRVEITIQPHGYTAKRVTA